MDSDDVAALNRLEVQTYFMDQNPTIDISGTGYTTNYLGPVKLNPMYHEESTIQCNRPGSIKNGPIQMCIMSFILIYDQHRQTVAALTKKSEEKTKKSVWHTSGRLFYVCSKFKSFTHKPTAVNFDCLW
ncbi:hypothetical protein GCM10010912_05190 [Paenibacillus albidus]|uniref:Uncharacterized protein n=2 Tax=Paenibacillus albidus TaxID=2041023 RepID=A0A917BZU3_9BACL|nr:hypothetical protein GCM10010912_05190 [Paenibacillus albidus]